MKNIFYILIIFFLSNCNQKETELNFEKEVMGKIFLDLVEHLYEPKLPTPPPPNKDIPWEYYSLNSKKRKDSFYNNSSEKVKTGINKYEKSKNESLRRFNDSKLTKELLIGIVDTIHKISAKNIEYAEKKTNINFRELKKSDRIEYKLDLTNYKSVERYNFEYYSSFPNKGNIWKWKYETGSDLKAILNFSRIIFDKDRKNGLLEVGISKGRLNGIGGLIIIKRINDKWIIVDYLGLSIS